MAAFLELATPALVALLIYLFVAYALVPLYRQRQRYSQYMPISLPSGASIPGSEWLGGGSGSGGGGGGFRGRLHEALAPFLRIGTQRYQGRSRSYSGLSDEEMDPVDGLEALHEHRWGRGQGDEEEDGNGEEREAGVLGLVPGRPRAPRPDEQPRLSRDLEAGFMDDSSSEDEESTRR